MSAYHGRDLRKPTGGKIRPHRKKRKRELGSPPTETILGQDERKSFRRAMGGNVKVGLKAAVYANISDPSTGTTRKVRILQVVKNPASADYSRRGVITKGAIIKTELGLARVTSRPGQDGVVNAVLIESSS